MPTLYVCRSSRKICVALNGCQIEYRAKEEELTTHHNYPHLPYGRPVRLLAVVAEHRRDDEQTLRITLVVGVAL